MLNYFFSGPQYIAVERGDVGHGTILPGYPKPISEWSWGSFGATGIDAALYSGWKCYFFKELNTSELLAARQILGMSIPAILILSKIGIFPVASAPLASTPQGALVLSAIFFKGNQYIRMHRDDTSFGTVDQGYPKDIGSGWPEMSFASGSVDAAMYSGSKAYFFSKSQYAQISEADL